MNPLDTKLASGILRDRYRVSGRKDGPFRGQTSLTRVAAPDDLNRRVAHFVLKALGSSCRILIFARFKGLTQRFARCRHERVIWGRAELDGAEQQQ